MFEPTPKKLLKELVSLRFSEFVRVVAGLDIDILPEDVVFQEMLKGKSFLRWGDGETALTRGKSIRYQTHSVELQSYLKGIWESPKNEIIIGIPFFAQRNILRLLDPHLYKIKVHFSTRVFLAPRISSYQLFSDTMFWYSRWQTMRFFFEQLAVGRSTLLISSDSDYLKACPSGTEILLVPKREAFSSFDAICKKVDKWIEISTRRPLILLGAGPMSKVLVHMFADRSQLVDIGHAFHFNKHGNQRYSWHDLDE
jgi:Glycosyltransferase GT-D fold